MDEVTKLRERSMSELADGDNEWVIDALIAAVRKQAATSLRPCPRCAKGEMEILWSCNLCGTRTTVDQFSLEAAQRK